MTTNMTEGSIPKCIISFAIPVFFGMLFQQFYNMADTMIVGKFLGINSLAGVGATGSLYFLVIGFCNGATTGFSIPIAQLFGANDYSRLRKLVVNSAFLSIFLSIIIATSTMLMCKDVLILMNTPAEIFQYAYIYIIIIFAGMPCTFLYNMSAAIMRSLGDSKTPVIFLIISSVLNILLDLLFIVIFHMNVEGAALATVIAQGVSGIISTIFLLKHFDILKFKKEELTIDKDSLIRLSAVGIPMGLQFSITAIGTIILQAAVNSFGAITVAGVTAAQKIQMFATCPLEALGPTMATFTGQNLGAGKLSRIGHGLKISTLIGFGCSAVLFIILFFFTGDLSLLFLNPTDTEAINSAYRFLLIAASGFPLLTCILTFRFTIQGMGYSAFAMIAGVLEMIARSIVAFTLPQIIGFTGVCLAHIAAWILADLFLIPAYFWCRNHLYKTMNYR